MPAAFWEKMASELMAWIKAEKINSRPNPPPLGGGIRIHIPLLASHYVTSDLLGLMREKEISASELLVDPENFAELIKMIVKKEINSRVAKDVLRIMVEQGGDPSTIIESKGLKQVGDEEVLEKIAQKIISQNPKAVEDFKKGKQQSLQFLVGQVMKETKGAANPEVIRALLTKIIGGV